MKHAAGILFVLIGATGCTVGDPSPPPVDGGADAGLDDAGPRCAPGRTACEGYTFYRCGEDGTTREDHEECEGACHPDDGCAAECEPGARRCDDGVSRVCTSAREWAFVRDCGEWGSSCGSGGVCADECGVAEASRLNVGCVFHPVPLANYQQLDRARFDFRVAIANPNDLPASVVVTRGTQRVGAVTVAPGRMELLTLPWMEQSNGFAAGAFEGLRFANGVYRLTTDRPVTVFQFNPFEYQADDGERAYTNDASVLYPAHALTGDYVASSFEPLSSEAPGYVAIAALDRDPTRVVVTTPIALAADRDGSWARVEAGGTLELTLAPREVVYLVPELPPLCDPEVPGGPRCPSAAHDPTGLRVRADHPVLAFGGHACANVPSTAGTCDHLEEQLAPVETLGRRFTSAPLVAPASGHRNLVRVVAAFDGTTITSTPSLSFATAEGPLEGPLAAGEWAQAFVTEAFAIETSEPAVVAQYILGAGDPAVRAAAGDPSLTVLVPEEQYHHGYVFATPSSYRAAAGGQSYVLLIREPGSAVTLDGAQVPGPWTVVGEREVRVVEVDGGIHRLRGDADLGAMVYGLGRDTSYAYPAGLDLERIVVPF